MQLSAKDKLTYGVGAFGYGSVNQMLGNYLMFFGTGVLGLSGTLMGLAMAIATVWDAVTDPLVGALSDNCRSRLGQRHGFMLVGCVVVALLNLGVWHISPAWSTTTKFLVLLTALLAMETFNTVYSTPYSALGFDLCHTYYERTSIQGFKTVFQSASLMVPSLLMGLVLPPQQYVTLNSTTDGYQIIAVITSSLCVLTGLITIFGTRRFRRTPPVRTVKPSLVKAFLAILHDKNNVFLIVAYAVALSCSALITTMGMHIFTYTFCFSSLQIPVVMGCLVAGIMLGQPLWCRVSLRLGKKDTVRVALSVVMVGVVVFAFILLFRGALGSSVLLLLVAADILVISAGVGCIYSLPISMFADNIAADSTAMATGFLTFCTKATNAGVTLLVGVILDGIGFRSGVATQATNVCTALGWVLVGGVACASVVASILFGKYQDKNRAAVV